MEKLYTVSKNKTLEASLALPTGRRPVTHIWGMFSIANPIKGYGNWRTMRHNLWALFTDQKQSAAEAHSTAKDLGMTFQVLTAPLM